MLVRPRGPKPKGFLAGAKATDKLPFAIRCYEEIVPKCRNIFPFNQAGDIVDFGPCYTREQEEEIKQLYAEGKAYRAFGSSRVYKLTDVITSVSKAKELGIPLTSQVYLKS